MDVTTILTAGVPTAIAFAISYLVHRKVVSKATLSELLVYGQWAVTAAEEAYKDMPQSGDAKLQTAMTALTHKFGITPEQARTIALTVVSQLRRQGLLGKQIGKGITGLVQNDPQAS